MHGGNALKGVAAPGFKDGRYSRYLPGRLLERYHAAEADVDLLNLSAEIALLDARLADLLKRVDSGEAGKVWKAAQKTNADIQKAYLDKDYGQLMISVRELDLLIGEGLADHEAWYEIQTLLDQRRRFAETERKRRIDMERMIPIEQATTLATALLHSVKRNVTDQATLSAIQADFARLMMAGATL